MDTDVPACNPDRSHVSYQNGLLVSGRFGSGYPSLRTVWHLDSIPESARKGQATAGASEWRSRLLQSIDPRAVSCGLLYLEGMMNKKKQSKNSPQKKMIKISAEEIQQAS